MSRFPFDHLTWAEVTECEALTVEHRAGRLRNNFVLAGRFRDLLRKRHQPLYDRDPPEPDGAA